MKITVVAVGKARGVLAPAIGEYLERARRYWNIDVVEVAESGMDRALEARKREAETLVSRLPADADIWVLTRKGKGTTSTALATLLESRAVSSGPDLAFVLGGAFGLGEPIVSAAQRQLALSPMTLPHDLARLVLLEQLYRAGTIRRGEPYHKGP